MKTDDFEKRLQRQPQREIPAAWREEILSVSQSGSQSPTVAIRSTLTITSFVFALWRELVRPARSIWAGLATAWVFILIANANLMTARPVASTEAKTHSAELWLMFREQNQLMAELSGTVEPKRIEPPVSNVPRPRSEAVSGWTTI